MLKICFRATLLSVVALLCVQCTAKEYKNHPECGKQHELFTRLYAAKTDEQRKALIKEYHANPDKYKNIRRFPWMVQIKMKMAQDRYIRSPACKGCKAETQFEIEEDPANPVKDESTCGGVLISEKYVLTAMHCFINDQERFQACNRKDMEYSDCCWKLHWYFESGKITLGIDKNDDPTSAKRTCKIGWEHLIFPATIAKVAGSLGEQNRGSCLKDIAMIDIRHCFVKGGGSGDKKGPLKIDDSIRPICLPKTTDDFRHTPGQKVTVIGWGKNESDGHQPKKLMQVSLDLWDTDSCRKNYAKYLKEKNHANCAELAPQEREKHDWNEADSKCPLSCTLRDKFSICDHHICANRKCDTPELKAKNITACDACQGDSGGPLIIRQPNNIFTLAGIVSLGKGCGELEYPGVYTHVPSVMKWIVAVTDTLG